MPEALVAKDVMLEAVLALTRTTLPKSGSAAFDALASQADAERDAEGIITMTLLTKEEFYKQLGQALRNLREERGLSRKQLAEQLNQMPVDPERHLRHIAALSIIAGHIRRQKGLSRKQVAERGNLPLEFVRDMEAGKIWNPETYSVYCLAYGLRTAYRTFEKKVDVLSRTELDENDKPVRRKKKHTSLPQPRPPLLLEPGSTEEEKS